MTAALQSGAQSQSVAELYAEVEQQGSLDVPKLSEANPHDQALSVDEHSSGHIWENALSSTSDSGHTPGLYGVQSHDQLSSLRAAEHLSGGNVLVAGSAQSWGNPDPLSSTLEVNISDSLTLKKKACSGNHFGDSFNKCNNNVPWVECGAPGKRCAKPTREICAERYVCQSGVCKQCFLKKQTA
eukprot:gnl/MRDRNA2_/MRDRNA2_74497_c0_seq1.p1 gnl/MRDRNA2_/MRDRNA2_74497_c0~~gnl/MRDRNA2_/MRDRNA2_74497_c0_seq1.p1  ORF type:complete len:198 (+),score=20.46 gnl/MRDRNA2_/MRDRNA2_74497_c0_seq1:45-596(+)